MSDEEESGSPVGLEPIHVKVEVHSINGFDFEKDMLGDDFVDGMCYTHDRLRSRFGFKLETDSK